MTEEKPTDYAAIIRAANTPTPQLPEWLKLGKTIKSPRYGVGEVISLLGQRLVVKFLGYSAPIQFKDCLLSVEAGEILPGDDIATTTAAPLNHQPPTQNRVSLAEIEAIPQLQFRAIASELADTLTTIEVSPPNIGEVYSIPKDLPVPLKQALKQVGITSLYSHQIEALEQLRLGKDLSIVTPTASGKTLCYNPAIIESCLNNPETSALYIFPLKALALDQLHKLERLVAALPANQRLKVGQMTGDTSYIERKQLFIPNPPHILAVSPDLLHYQLEKVRRGIGEPWREFLRRLRWVVVDESHTYIGAFGAHFANLIRRLRRSVDSVGGSSEKLQFIFSSATIGNPAEMALRFSGRVQQPEKLHLIENSGSGSAGKTILCLAPSDTPNPDACKIILSWLQQDLSGIVFCNSRAAVKSLLTLIRKETHKQGMSYLSHKVAVFYGSLKGDRRREIINGLRTGTLKVILSTSALESGIDLPELDCCLVRGYPGSIMSFRQRIGRAGRKNPGLVIFLPVAQNPIDYYYGTYPKQLLLGEVESAAFNPDYPTILSKHLECSCVESGLPVAEVNTRFGNSAGAIIDALIEQNKTFISAKGLLRGQGYPHRMINLRGNSFNTIELIDKNTGETFEEMPYDIAYKEVFPGAIYTAYDGSGNLVTYRSESLNIEDHQAVLVPLEKNTELYTQAKTDLDINFLEDLETPRITSTAFPEGRIRLRLGWGEITSLVTGYKLFSKEYRLTCPNYKCSSYHQPLAGYNCSNCGTKLRYAEITRVIQEVNFEQPYQTQYQAPVVKMQLNPGVVKGIATEVDKLKDKVKAEYDDIIPERLKILWFVAPEFLALHSITHQIQFAVPLVVLSSSNDINCVIQKQGEHTFGYFFDTCDGGNGAAEAIFHQLPLFAAKAKSLAETCDCSEGCPRCLIQHGCPQQNEALHKQLGLSLLDAICHQKGTGNGQQATEGHYN